MRATEAAWIAGIIDGEGSICLCAGSRNRVTVYPSVAVSSTTPVILQTLVRFTGLARVSSAIQNGWGRKPIYKWVVVSRQAERVLEKVLPYLVLKRQQAKLALKVMRNSRRNGKGRKLTAYENNLRAGWIRKMKGLNK